MAIALKSPVLSPIREHSTATAYSASLPSRINMPPRSGRIVLFTVFLFILFVYSSFRFGDTEERITRLKAYSPHGQNGGNANTGEDVKQGPSIEGSARERTPGAGPIQDVRNSTLGFQKVFLINLPERTDKLDAFSLASSLSDFTYDLIPGIHGAEIPDKSLPAIRGLPDRLSTRNNQVGCWRAHLNFARKIVNDRLTSALVIEDDADWSLLLKDQLALFAQGAQYILSPTRDSKTPPPLSSPISSPISSPTLSLPQPPSPHSPYGDNWDLLWLGHCGTEITPNDTYRFVVENDMTVPPTPRLINFGPSTPDLKKEGLSPSSRVVFTASSGLCTYAYALSYKGASKVLQYQNSQIDEFHPIDLGLAKMCKEEDNFHCIGVFPQIIDSHKRRGKSQGDSDIARTSEMEEGEIREKGYTPNVVHSVRCNLDRLVRGDKMQEGQEQEWSQYGADEGPKIEPGGSRTRELEREKDA